MAKAINSKKLLIIFVLFFMLVGTLLLRHCFQESSYEDKLLQSTNNLNKKCPLMVDNETRLDSGQILPNKCYQYNYTLINYDKLSLDIEGLKKSVEPVILNNVKQSNDTRLLRENDATIIYAYKDKEGVSLFSITITPSEYKK